MIDGSNSINGKEVNFPVPTCDNFIREIAKLLDKFVNGTMAFLVNGGMVEVFPHLMRIDFQHHPQLISWSDHRIFNQHS